MLVTGVPGSGKSTLARRLGPALGLPVLSLDALKEVLFSTLGVGDRDWSLQIRTAALGIIWSVLPDFPDGAVIDIWIDPTRDPEAVRTGLAQTEVGEVREILCDVPGDVAAQRYAARDRHPGHLPADAATLTRIREAARSMAPLGVGRALRVNTTREVDVNDLVDWLRER